MLHIEDSNVVSIKIFIKVRSSRATIVLITTIVVYLIVIRSAIKNNIKKIIKNTRRISSLRVIILIIIDVLDFNAILVEVLETLSSKILLSSKVSLSSKVPSSSKILIHLIISFD